MLRALLRDEPAPPRKLCPGAPADLETVVLKAMSKEPQGRYLTARELADDLGRFLADRPVLARRPGPVERARRWARRHKPVVWAAALLPALLAAVSLAAAALIARERSAALAERDRAVAQRARALKAIGVLTTELNITRPGEPPEATLSPRREALEQSLASYGELLRELGDDPELAGAVELARRRVAQLQNDVAWMLVTPRGAPRADAERAARLAREALERVPDNWAYWNTLGVALYRAGELGGAVEALERSLACRQARPDPRGEVDSFNGFFLAMAHWRRGEREKARRRYDQAVWWMEDNYPREGILVSFRSEAAALLGIAWTPSKAGGRSAP